MSDIVGRLWERADDKFIRDAPLLREAAIEIERLRRGLLRVVGRLTEERASGFRRGCGVYSAWGLETRRLLDEPSKAERFARYRNEWVR